MQPDQSRPIFPPLEEEYYAQNFLPEEASREAERYELGVPLICFEPSLISAVAGTLFFYGVAVTFGLAVLSPLNQHSTPSMLLSPDRLMLVLVMVALYLTMLFLLWICFLGTLRVVALLIRTHQRSYACTRGFLIMKGRNCVVAVVRWEEIWDMAYDFRSDTDVSEYWLVTKEGTKIAMEYKLWDHAHEIFKQLHPDYVVVGEEIKHGTLFHTHVKESSNE